MCILNLFLFFDIFLSWGVLTYRELVGNFRDHSCYAHPVGICLYKILRSPRKNRPLPDQLAHCHARFTWRNARSNQVSYVGSLCFPAIMKYYIPGLKIFCSDFESGFYNFKFNHLRLWINRCLTAVPILIACGSLKIFLHHNLVVRDKETTTEHTTRLD